MTTKTVAPAAAQVQAADPLEPLKALRQWIVVMLVPLANGKTDKLPIDYRTGNVTPKGAGGAHNPEIWLDYQAADALAKRWGSLFGTGFVLTASDPFWCLDIDNCRTATGRSDLATSLVAALPGTVVEVSQSERGLHVWGQGPVPPHSMKRVDLGIELYTEGRFILIGTGAQGDMNQPCPTIAAIAASYFPPRAGASGAVNVADEGPSPDWRGPTDDAELIRRALRSQSAGSVFGGARATFADLWTGDVQALARAYPASGDDPYDRSSADAALAQHLAFWTGRDPQRIERLMRQSALVREKWDNRDDYLVERTIRGACGRQVEVLKDKCTADEAIADMSMLSGEEILAQWVGRAAPMSRAEADKFADWVAFRTGSGKALLKAELSAQRAEQRRQAADAVVAALAGPKELIQHRPDACTEQARYVESLILRSAAPGEYVVFGGVLAQVTSRPLPHTHLIDQADSAPPDVPQIEPHNDVGVWGHVERVAAFYELTAAGSKRLIAVPERITRVLMDKTAHAAPVLTGLMTHPIVLPTGAVLASDGLHQGTGLYVWNAPAKDARPYAQHEAAASLQRLRATVLDGFEFATQLDADIALAGLFTAVQRRVLDSAPGLAVLASMQASGKTTLTRRLHILLTGRDMPASTFPFDNEAEAQKQLLSMLLRGPAMVCFDNVPDGYAFRSGVLSAAMTSPEFTQRILGVSKDAAAPTNVFFALTGNNLTLGADEVTRWMIARLAPRTAHPEERHFRHPNVLAHGLACREQVLRDVVGIVAGCRVAGGTPVDNATRFPTWDMLVRQPLIWAGASDVAEVFRANRDQSEPVVALRGLIWALLQMFGERPFSAAEVQAMPVPGSSVSEVLRTALETLGATKADSTRSRGKVLSGQTGKVADVEGVEWVIRSQPDRTGTARYWLARPH